MQEMAFQIAALSILIIFTVFSLIQKRVTLISNKFYFVVFVMAYVTVFMEIASYEAVKFLYEDYGPLASTLYRLYLCTIVISSWAIQMYILINLRLESKRLKIFIIVSSIIFALAICVYIYVHKLALQYDNGTVITEIGLTYIHSFIGALCFSLTSIYLTLRFRKNIKKNRFISTLIWQGVWVVSTIVQAWLPRFMIAGLACSVGVVILYLKLENPDFQKDLYSGAYNYNALLTYLIELNEKKQNYYAILITYPKKKLGFGSYESDNCYKASNIQDIVKSKTNGNLFLTLDNELFFVTFDMNDYYILKEELEKLKDFYYREYGAYTDVILDFVIFDSKMDEVNYQAFYFLFKFAMENKEATNVDSHELFISTNTLYEFKRSRVVEKCLNNAIEQEKIEVFYQPIFGNKENKFVSVEALCRMKDNNNKYVPPDYFIDMAEKNGTIIKLGKIIFRKVCEFIKYSNLEEYGVEHVEINLSAKQSESSELASQLIEIMDAYRINPKLINLEITESASIKNLRRVQNNINQLREYGVTFSLDDYGKGEANLNYLIGLPFDIVKIDAYLTRAYFSSNMKSKNLVHDTIKTLHKLEYEVVVEGVETEEQLKGINALGTDYIQGYYYSKPLPEDQYLNFLATHNYRD